MVRSLQFCGPPNTQLSAPVGFAKDVNKDAGAQEKFQSIAKAYEARVGTWKGKKWVFPKIMVPQNGWFIMENPIKMDDLGVPLFLETPKCSCRDH